MIDICLLKNAVLRDQLQACYQAELLEYVIKNKQQVIHYQLSLVLGPSINGLVTAVNIKLCCQGSVLALFHSIKANKIDSDHTRDYMKLFPVCKVEILQVTVNKIEVL